MNRLKKRCKKRLRKVWCFNMLCCFSIDQENENSYEDVQKISQNTNTESLQLLVIRTLQNQIEDREFYGQLQNALRHFTAFVDQFSMKNTCVAIDKLSKFTVTVSNSSLTYCNTDYRSKSLIALSERSYAKHALVLHGPGSRQLSGSMVTIFPTGGFRSSNDKAIQYRANVTTSKLIQTQFANLSSFDMVDLKINLIKHIRSLKQDVITLRQLLFSVDHHHHLGGNLNTRPESDLERTFFQAKLRAANFMKFYKLRKIDGKKNEKSVGRRERIIGLQQSR